MFNNRRLMGMLRQTGALFPLIVSTGFLGGGMVILQSLQLSKVITEVFLRGQTLKAVKVGLELFGGIVLVRVLFTMLNNGLANALAVKIKTLLRMQLLEKIDRLGPAYTQTQQSGELVTTAFQGVEALDAYFSQYLPQVLLAAMLPLLILIVVFPLDWLSGLVFLVTAPLIPFFMALVGRASEAETKKQWNALSRLGADFLDTLQGLTTLKILGQSKAQVKRVEEVSDRYRLATMNVLRITFLSALVLELLATISTAVVAVEIGLRLLYDKLFFEQAFFVLLLAPEFYQPMRNLGMRYHAGMNGVTASVRIFQLLDIPGPSHIQFSERVPQLNLRSSFTLAFQNVSFAYPQSTADSLRDLQLQLQSGRSYALVGHSGAGKSTLLKLIIRFIEPSAGRMTLNGIDARSYDLEVWRNQVSWVPQRPMLFNTTLLENIRLEDKSISADRVWQALEQAHLADFVKALPEKLDTPLGEWGARFSGGQAQRVALARAFLKDAQLVLLDEPAEHLDADLEAEMAQSMHELLHGRTVVTIAHHFNTVQRSDEMIVLDHGEIVEQGRPEQLLQTREGFTRFYPSQGETMI